MLIVATVAIGRTPSWLKSDPHALYHESDQSASPHRTSLRTRKFFDRGKKSLPFANEWAITANRRGDAQPEISQGVMTMYRIRLHLEPNPDGIYTVTSPDVPGLVTEGRTPAEILSNVEGTLAALLEAWAELGQEPPTAFRPVNGDQPETFDILMAPV